MSSCKRKELYFQEYTQLKVVIDWPDNNEQKPLYNELVMYPIDGFYTTPKVFYLDKDTTVIDIPVGKYNGIFYNWKTNTSVQTTQFQDRDDKDAFIAYTNALVLKTNEIVLENFRIKPDMLYGWSNNNDSYIQASAFLTDQDMKTLVIDPIKIVKDYDIDVEVIGKEFVRAISVVVSGVNQQYMMYQQKDTIACQHNVDLASITEGYNVKFTSFSDYEGSSKNLQFYIRMPNDSLRLYERELKVIDGKNKAFSVEPINIEYYGPLNEGSGGDGWAPPIIVDWGGVEEDIEI